MAAFDQCHRQPFRGTLRRAAEPGDILRPMTDFSRAEAAHRAGLDEAYLDRLVDLGLLGPGAGDRFTKFDIRKAQMLHALQSAGMPPDGVAEGLRSAAMSLAFLESPVYERAAERAR